MFVVGCAKAHPLLNQLVRGGEDHLSCEEKEIVQLMHHDALKILPL